MILHCYRCALAGDRCTESSEVAIIDQSTFKKPLRASMFKPLDPGHDPSPPFQSDEWRHMLHRACGSYPWPYDVDPVEGPSRVLTDKGFIQIPTNNVPVKEPEDKEYVCDVCGKSFSTYQALGGHKRIHSAG